MTTRQYLQDIVVLFVFCVSWLVGGALYIAVLERVARRPIVLADISWIGLGTLIGAAVMLPYLVTVVDTVLGGQGAALVRFSKGIAVALAAGLFLGLVLVSGLGEGGCTT